MYKTCCKCGSEKSLDRFYKNNRTKDGLCSRCSKCLKEYAKQRYDNKIKNPDLIEKERIKNRERYHRLDYKKRWRPSSESKNEKGKEYRLKYPEKYKAHNSINKMNAEIKGNHLHHWSYKEEHIKDVIELEPKIHAFIHRYIKYDQSEMMYRVSSNFNGWDIGELLHSRNYHQRFIASCIRQKEIGW